jgi:hypothetical protein
MSQLTRIDESEIPHIKIKHPDDEFPMSINEFVSVENHSVLFYRYNYKMLGNTEEMIVARTIGLGWWIQNFDGVLVPIFGKDRSRFHYNIYCDLIDCNKKLIDFRKFYGNVSL